MSELRRDGGLLGEHRRHIPGGLWELMGHHARIAHDENAAEWDDETVDYFKTLVKEVDV